MKFFFSLILLMIITATSVFGVDNTSISREEIHEIAYKAAERFNYYDEISSSALNVVSSGTEIGGQCGDYALAFANIWNARHEAKALLVIQQQGLADFPDGFYEILGIDNQELPFLEERSTSMLYKWNNILGIGHPEIGGYRIRLIKEVHVKSHFDLDNWENNGPHIWVKIGDIGVDPTYTDLGGLPTIGRDTYQ